MSTPRRILIFGGTALAAIAMLYGLHYALFVEHQTLDQMGGSLATAFVEAANENAAASHAAIDSFGSTKYDYVREVDAHSHWIGLSMILIVLGAIFDQVALSLSVRKALAWSLLLGSIIFPLGVVLQISHRGGSMPSALAIVGSVLVIVGMAGAAFGLAMNREKTQALRTEN
jgi:hypothetical protein